MNKNLQSQDNSGRPKPAGHKLDRRRFLIGLGRGFLLGAFVLLIDQIARFLSFQPARENSTIVALGPPQDYPPGALNYVETARAYVGRDENGLYALDAVCTHLGCLVEKRKKGGFTCPCHGSRFDEGGQVKTRPATKSLGYLQLWLEPDGQLMVDRSTPAEPTARLMV